MTEQEFKFNLQQFTGTENIYRYMFNLKITDGVRWVCENAGNGCFWFADVICSWQQDKKLKGEEFQVWKLQKTSDSTAIVTCEDGNKNVLIKQEIPYTDFPYSTLTFWCVNNIVLLPSEY